MSENNEAGSVSEQPENVPEAWVNAALKTAEQEISRLVRLGFVPYTLDRDDLRSEANEIITTVLNAPEAHVRTALRTRLIDLIKREYMKQRQELPQELLPQAGLPFSVGAIEFHQMTVGLTAKQLEAVNLVYLCGETEDSAATLLGIDQSTLSRRLSAAILRMKTFLQCDCIK